MSTNVLTGVSDRLLLPDSRVIEDRGIGAMRSGSNVKADKIKTQDGVERTLSVDMYLG